MNVAGAGPFSEVVACMTPASVPAVVTCLRGLSEDEVESPHYSPSTCLAISWEEPCDHGSEILGYSIDFGDKQPITVGKDLTYFIDGLQPDTTYRYVMHSYLTAYCFLHKSRCFVSLYFFIVFIIALRDTLVHSHGAKRSFVMMIIINVLFLFSVKYNLC